MSDRSPSGLALAVEGLTVRFNGFRALDGLDFAVSPGELRFVIGPNGAGKTTLVDAVTGSVRPAGGSIRAAGGELTRLKEHEIAALGVGRTFQTPAVFEALTVAENVDLALRRGRRIAGLLRRAGAEERERVVSALRAVSLAARSETRAGALSHGEKKWLEIGMLIAQDCRLLLLDEPVAGMTPPERERTGELLGTLEGAHTAVVIEHDMAFLRAFGRTVTVLHEGRLLAEGPVGQVQRDPEVVRIYLGREREEEPAPPAGRGRRLSVSP